jgi:hypothetical protein
MRSISDWDDHASSERAILRLRGASKIVST